jgi:hypothetical protein
VSAEPDKEAPGGGPPYAHLRADCASCLGLCCVAPSFQAQQGFGFSKPAHSPCRHLQTDFRCRIHEELQFRGFPACSAFECYGAGQRVTRLFHGASWTDSPQAAARIFQAYSRYRALHELLAMLELALERAPAAQRAQLERRLRALDAWCDSGEALTSAVVPERLRAEVLAQIRQALREDGESSAAPAD